MVEYFTQPVPKRKDFGMGKITNVRVDESMVKGMVVKLYTDPNSGIRELYANSINACKKAKRKYGADPSITIIINQRTMKLTIVENDSTGMTTKTFEEIFTVIGRSGNNDGELPGQFGVGMAAYHALSDTILVETYSRESEERFIKFGIGVMSFEDLTDRSKTSLDKYGSKFTLTLRVDDENMDAKRRFEQCNPLIEMIKKCAMFAEIPTTLVIKDDYGTNEYKIGSISPAEYFNQGRENVPHHTIFTIDNEKYRFDIGDATASNIVTLAGIPIEANLPIPVSYYTYVLQIKNERLYKPTVSRDSLTKETVEKLSVSLKKDIVETISKKINMDDISTCLDKIPEMRILSNMHSDKSRHDYIDKDLLNLLNAYNDKCTIYIHSLKVAIKDRLFNVFANYMYNRSADEVRIIKDALKTKDVGCIKYATKWGLKKHFKGIYPSILIIPNGRSEHRENIVRRLVKSGVKEIKMDKDIEKDTLVLHYLKKTIMKSKRMFPDELKENPISIEKGNIKKVLANMVKNGVEGVIIYDGDKKYGVTVDNYCKDWLGRKFGDVSGSEIIKHPDKYFLVPDSHILADKINLDIIRKYDWEGNVPVIININNHDMNHLAAAALFTSGKKLQMLKDNLSDVKKWAKIIYSLETYRIDSKEVWAEYMNEIKSLLDSINEQELRNAIVQSIDKSNRPAILVDFLKDTLVKYDGITDAYAQLLQNSEKADLTDFEQRKFSRYIRNLLYGRIDYDKESVCKMLKKYYFPNVHKISIIWTNKLNIRLEISTNLITKATNRRNLNKLRNQTNFPSAFSSIRMSKSGKYAVLLLEDQ